MDTSTVDLLALIGADTHLKRVSSHRGGEYHGACPFCGGKDRFRVQPKHNGGFFVCRQCGKSGDAITYVRLTRGLTYAQALEYLGLQGNAPAPRRAPMTPAPTPVVSLESDWQALHNPAWQVAANAFVRECVGVLESTAGKPARDYLAGRGLTEDVIRTNELGYNPAERRMKWGGVSVWLPRGIVLPWRIDGELWKVNIRQRDPRDPEKRYIQAAGGANGMYNADCVTPGCTVVMVEGEIDALSVYSGASEAVTQNRVVPVATGSNVGARLMRWVIRISLADRVLLAFDDDEAGEQAAAWWLGVFGSKAQRLKPLHHDVNESLQFGDDLNAWIWGETSEAWAEAMASFAERELGAVVTRLA